MNPVSCLHSVILTNSLSRTNTHQCLTLANIFSDAPQIISHNALYASLGHTRFWFQDDSHILQKIAEGEVPLNKKVIFGENLLHTFFFAILTRREGIQFLNTNSLPLRRMLKTVSWKQWLHAAQKFTSFLDISTSEKTKNSVALSQFANNMQDLRIAKPSFVPQSIGKNELTARFGSFVTKMWLEWRNQESLPWVFHHHETPTLPEDFTASSDDIFPSNTSIAISEIENVFRETFFKSLEKVAALNTPFDAHGLLDFTCRLHGNANCIQETSLHLAVPVFKRHKLSERVVQSCASTISKNTRNPSSEMGSQGIRTVPEIAWIERIEIIPQSISLQQNTVGTLFETEAAQKALEVKNTLLMKEIGKVFTPVETEHNTLYAFSMHNESFIHLRHPRNFVFGDQVPKKVVFAKTEGDIDFFQVHFPGNENIHWMSAPSQLRNKPFSQREPILLGFCAEPIDEVRFL
jgi:hypothetical protein